jgi:predicted metal-dependent peptidase
MNPQQQTATERKLSRARTQLLLNQPFFGALCLRLKLSAGSVPTMATDGCRVLYNPDFVDALKPAELEPVLAHEAMHCALAHHCRRGERDRELWNEAADFAINPILLGNGFTLPAGALNNPSFANLSAEEIYARFLRQKSGSSAATPGVEPSQAGSDADSGDLQENVTKSVGDSSGTGGPQGSARGDQTKTAGDITGRAGKFSIAARPGGFGEVLDAMDERGNRVSQAEQSRQEHEWNIAADQAMQSAKACGREPGMVERPLNESREWKQDWRAILRDFVAATSPSDYRWTPPNRRYVASGLYLPSVERRGVGTIIVAVDTSCSIGKSELEQFAGEISAISEEAQPEKILVVYCDAAVQSTQEFGPAEPVELQPKGGGGTDFRPAFGWVTENDVAPVCLIYLTDLCCDSYPEPPEYPVLWVTDSRRAAPFGDTIRITVQ